MRGKVLMYGDVQLYYDDVESCSAGNWLKDSIIEYQYERWERDLFKDCPNIAFVRPALVYLLQSVKSDVGLNLSAKDFIFFPINNGIADQSSGTHWSLLVYEKVRNLFYYYDSLGDSNLATAIAFKCAVEGIFPAGSGFLKMKTPQQTNGYDCGVFVLEITRILADRRAKSNDIDVEIFNEKLNRQRMMEVRTELAKDIEIIAKSLSERNCPVSSSCEYYKQHANDAGDCPLKTANCPYYNEHKSDSKETDFLTTKDHKCPLGKAGCSFYNDVKDGSADSKTYNWDNSACPLAGGKCSFYNEIKSDGEHEKLKHCPLLKNCPHYSKPGVHSYDSAKMKDCPHFKSNSHPHSYHAYHKGDTKSCPHMAGKDVESKCPWLASDHQGCPAKTKCPHYQKIKEGNFEDIDLSHNDCPLKEKCPYYQEFKEDPSKLKDCPHFTGDDGNPHPPHKYHSYHTGDTKSCPRMAGKDVDKACPWLSKDHEGCPAKGMAIADTEKCPHFQKIKAGNFEDIDLTHNDCPLKDKCPYYKEFKNDPHKLQDCPHFTGKDDPQHHHHKHFHGKAAKCPHMSGNEKDCPYMSEKHEDCPAKESCPYYKKAQEGNLEDIDLSNSECPLNEKCPYYAEFKKDPSKLKGCPAKSASGDCPHLHRKDSNAKFGKVSRTVIEEEEDSTKTKAATKKAKETKKIVKKYGDGADHDEL